MLFNIRAFISMSFDLIYYHIKYLFILMHQAICKYIVRTFNILNLSPLFNSLTDLPQSANNKILIPDTTYQCRSRPTVWWPLHKRVLSFVVGNCPKVWIEGDVSLVRYGLEPNTADGQYICVRTFVCGSSHKKAFSDNKLP